MIVRPLNEYFGIPIKELTYLSVIAVVFCIYSATCFLSLNDSFTTFIKFIGIANLMYCALTIGLMIKYYPLLTIIGTAYFFVEIAIICGLSYVELTVSTRNREK